MRSVPLPSVLFFYCLVGGGGVMGIPKQDCLVPKFFSNSHDSSFIERLQFCYSPGSTLPSLSLKRLAWITVNMLCLRLPLPSDPYSLLIWAGFTATYSLVLSSGEFLFQGFLISSANLFWQHWSLSVGSHLICVRTSQEFKTFPWGLLILCEWTLSVGCSAKLQSRSIHWIFLSLSSRCGKVTTGRVVRINAIT